MHYSLHLDEQFTVCVMTVSHSAQMLLKLEKCIPISHVTLETVPKYANIERPTSSQLYASDGACVKRGRRGAGLLRDCCEKNLLNFYSVVGPWCGWTAHMIRAYSAGSVAALIWHGKENQHAENPLRDASTTQPISYKELTATSVKIEHIFISLSL